MAHRPEVAVGVGGETVLERFDGGLERSERGAQIVADGGEEGAPGGVVVAALCLGPSQPLDHRVERGGRGAELVSSADPGTCLQISARNAIGGPSQRGKVVAQRAGDAEGEDDAEAGGDTEHDAQQVQVVHGQEHPPRPDRHRECDETGRDQPDGGDGVAERTTPGRGDGDEPGGPDGESGHGGEQGERLEAVRAAGVHDRLEHDHAGGDGEGGGCDCGLHGSNR